MSDNQQAAEGDVAATIAWPDDWPLYRQRCYSGDDDFCDVLVGHCLCGACHMVGEFELRDGVIYRYGKPADTYETANQQAERRELMERACRHLSDDELRGGVVSRKVAERLDRALCLGVDCDIDERYAAMAAYEQEVERGK